MPVDIDRPTPPFWGTKLLQPEDMPFEELFWYLDLQALIAGQWQFRKPKDQSREEYDEFLAEKVYPILETWKSRVITEKLLCPQAIYGYFPCQAEGNTLLIYDSEEMSQTGKATRVVNSFEFPRQKSGRRLCITDFFAPKESGIIDVFPMHAVTVGEIATEFAQKLFADNQYTDYLYFHGMAVQTAEAMAEWLHARIRRELGFGSKDADNIKDILRQRYQGSRYSFGYPACPDHSDKRSLFALLDAKSHGFKLTESCATYPASSVSGLYFGHPEAKYFGINRIDEGHTITSLTRIPL